MLLLKFSFLIVILTSCGFKPIYSESNQNEIRSKLSNIQLERIDNILGSKLYNLLEDKLHSTGEQKKYLLSVTLSKDSTPLTIQKNSFITNYNTIINVNYQLKSLDEGQILYKNSITNKSEYHAVNKLFANYAAEEDAFNNNLQQISEMILRDLILFFHSYNKL